MIIHLRTSGQFTQCSIENMNNTSNIKEVTCKVCLNSHHSEKKFVAYKRNKKDKISRSEYDIFEINGITHNIRVPKKSGAI